MYKDVKISYEILYIYFVPVHVTRAHKYNIMFIIFVYLLYYITMHYNIHNKYVPMRLCSCYNVNIHIVVPIITVKIL